MKSPSIIHQPFPISQITPSTIVLGSSYYNTSSGRESLEEFGPTTTTTTTDTGTTPPTMASPQPSSPPLQSLDTDAAAPAPNVVASSASNSPPLSSPSSSSSHQQPFFGESSSSGGGGSGGGVPKPSTGPVSSIVASLERSVANTDLNDNDDTTNNNDTDDNANETDRDNNEHGTTTTPTQQQEHDNDDDNNNNNNTESDTVPFSSRQLDAASSVLVTSNDPPERCTSPRRDNSAIERIGREKVHVLRKEAQLMQDSLTDILDRLVLVRDEYDRLSSENKFLQDYIGNLMATSNILNKT